MVAVASLHPQLRDTLARIHQPTRVMPATAAGVADHPWEVEEIVGLLKEEAVVILR